MVSEMEIWRAAQQMINQYGENAEFEAAQHADQGIDKSDPKMERIWVQIGKAIKHLMENRPTGPLN